MKPIMEREELMEYLTGAFIAGRDGIELDFERIEASVTADFENRIGRPCGDSCREYIARIFKGMREVYEMGRKAAEGEAVAI